MKITFYDHQPAPATPPTETRVRVTFTLGQLRALAGFDPGLSHVLDELADRARHALLNMGLGLGPGAAGDPVRDLAVEGVSGKCRCEICVSTTRR